MILPCIHILYIEILTSLLSSAFFLYTHKQYKTKKNLHTKYNTILFDVINNAFLESPSTVLFTFPEKLQGYFIFYIHI